MLWRPSFLSCKDCSWLAKQGAREKDCGTCPVTTKLDDEGHLALDLYSQLCVGLTRDFPPMLALGAQLHLPDDLTHEEARRLWHLLTVAHEAAVERDRTRADKEAKRKQEKAKANRPAKAPRKGRGIFRRRR